MRSNVGLSLSWLLERVDTARPGPQCLERWIDFSRGSRLLSPLKHGTSQGKIRERLERPACLQRHYRTRCGIRRCFGAPGVPGESQRVGVPDGGAVGHFRTADQETGCTVVFLHLANKAL